MRIRLWQGPEVEVPQKVVDLLQKAEVTWQQVQENKDDKEWLKATIAEITSKLASLNEVQECVTTKAAESDDPFFVTGPAASMQHNKKKEHFVKKLIEVLVQGSRKSAAEE